MIGSLLARRLVATSIGLGAVALVGTAPQWRPVAESAATRGSLSVVANPHPARFLSMSPGAASYWTQQVSLSGASQARFSVRVNGWGAVVTHRSGATIAVNSCTREYPTNTSGRPTCPGVEAVLLAATPLSQVSSSPHEGTAEHTWHLDDLRADSPRSFLVTLAIPKTAAGDKSLMGLTGNYGIGFYASGDSPASTPTDVDEGSPTDDTDGWLPNTGGVELWWLIVAGVLLAAGTTSVIWGRRR